MPPANTPARTPSRPHTPTRRRPLTPLSYLSSPAPNLAATLHTHAADAADDANVSFLRASLDLLEEDSPPARPSQTQLDPLRDPRQTTPTRDRASTGAITGRPAGMSRPRQESLEDLTRRERLQRVLARLNRYYEPSAPATAAYSNRTPSPSRQSLYDWAPGAEEGTQDETDLEAILAELRRQQPDMHPSVLRVLGQSQLEHQRQTGQQEPDVPNLTTWREVVRRRDREQAIREMETNSLRLQASSRRTAQEASSSPSATDRMLRHVLERERSGLSEEEERARHTGWFRPTISRPGYEYYDTSITQREHRSLPPPPADDRPERTERERVEAFRRGYLPANVPSTLPRPLTPPVPAPLIPIKSSPTLLENALVYLDELRFCVQYEEAMNTAMDHNLATREFLADKHDDFVMDRCELPDLAYSSWLQPGASFEGDQHAASNGVGLTHRRRSSPSHVVEQINPNFRSSMVPSFDRSSATASRSQRNTGHWERSSPDQSTSLKPSDPAHDRWPVRVVIHAVDPDNMTLQGTMEAYDVPQHPSSLSVHGSPPSERPRTGNKSAPIITYLEGHIIDLRTHSLLTPEPEGGSTKSRLQQTGNRFSSSSAASSSAIVFPAASARIDAANWRKLPPFRALSSDDELARQLLSRTGLAALHRDYIFMRWKERCFVHARHDACAGGAHGDQDRGHGLTISGFYYIALRRADGAIDGLYFDPSSAPHQHLHLAGCSTGWPAFEFR